MRCQTEEYMRWITIKKIDYLMFSFIKHVYNVIVNGMFFKFKMQRNVFTLHR